MSCPNTSVSRMSLKSMFETMLLSDPNSFDDPLSTLQTPNIISGAKDAILHIFHPSGSRASLSDASGALTMQTSTLLFHQNSFPSRTKHCFMTQTQDFK